MNTNLRRTIFVLAIICFIVTVATTDHALSAAALGLLLGYTVGITYPYKEDEGQ